MPITRAGPMDVRRIRQLITRSRYTYTNFGLEDLSTLISEGVVMLATENGRANAYLCIKRDGTALRNGVASVFSGNNFAEGVTESAVQGETAPHRPVDTQSVRREYVRGIAMESDQSPTERLAALLDAAAAEIECESAEPFEFVCYGSDRWLERALRSSGFEIQERIEFFSLNKLGRFVEKVSVVSGVPDTESPPIRIRELYSNELKPLVALDATAFDAFWHLNEAQMLEMLFRARVRVAVKEQEIVGYSALILNRDEVGVFADNSMADHQAANGAVEAQLARLAIHPQYHGHGFGRRLLAEVIGYAYGQGVKSMTLNTQTSNRQSRRLYRSFGFRTTGHILPVLRKAI